MNCPHCKKLLDPYPIGQEVTLNRIYQDDDFSFNIGTKGVIESIDTKNKAFYIRFCGLLLWTPQEYVDIKRKNI